MWWSDHFYIMNNNKNSQKINKKNTLNVKSIQYIVIQPLKQLKYHLCKYVVQNVHR
jgi:hypothetical protein